MSSEVSRGSRSISHSCRSSCSKTSSINIFGGLSFINSRRLTYMQGYGDVKEEFLNPFTMRRQQWRSYSCQISRPDCGNINAISDKPHHPASVPGSLYADTSGPAILVNDERWNPSQNEVLLQNHPPPSSFCNVSRTTPHQPTLTYVICLVQVGFFVYTMLNSDFGPVGLVEYKSRVVRVRLPNLTINDTCLIEYNNPWIGPRIPDLIHKGAFYPPCMRFDPHLYRSVIKRQITLDRESTCCISRDQRLCYQAAPEMCKAPLYTTVPSPSDSLEGFQISSLRRTSITSLRADNWGHRARSANGSVGNGINSQISGLVCGLDPRFCIKHEPNGNKFWSQHDVTTWPICEQTNSVWNIPKAAQHMRCEVVARPCCVDIRGECIMATGEHCKRIGGVFHPQAALCSQVNCLQRSCGLSRFRKAEEPDQLYRILISPLLHAGFVHIGLSMIFQVTFMRTVEQEYGWLPVATIYFLSNCFGQMLSAFFLPYQLLTGPSPAQIGILGMMITQMATHGHSNFSLRIRLIFSLPFFIAGFFPWMSNIAHCGGLISGLLFGFMLDVRPTMSKSCIRLLCVRGIGSKNTEHSSMARISRSRVFAIWGLCATWWILFIGFIITFIFGPVVRCRFCIFLSCIPILPGSCKTVRVDMDHGAKCYK